MVFVIVVANRQRSERLAAVFMVNTALLFGAERINGLAARHWKSFATQQYFDPAGAFMMVMVGMPMLVCQLVILVFLLREAAKMVIKVKRLELRKTLVEKKKEEKKA